MKELGRPRWKDNTNMDIKHWIYLARDRNKWQAVLNEVMSLQVLYDVGYFKTSSKNIELLCNICPY